MVECIYKEEKMTKQEALDFIRESEATKFAYGDLSIPVDKNEALTDIAYMDELLWNNGLVIEYIEEVLGNDEE
jgi:hypothetical protein